MNKFQIVSLIVLIGMPLLFLLISFIASDWRYFIYSIPGSLTAGIIGLYVSRNANIKEKNGK